MSRRDTIGVFQVNGEYQFYESNSDVVTATVAQQREGTKGKAAAVPPSSSRYQAALQSDLFVLILVSKCR